MYNAIMQRNDLQVEVYQNHKPLFCDMLSRPEMLEMKIIFIIQCPMLSLPFQRRLPQLSDLLTPPLHRNSALVQMLTLSEWPNRHLVVLSEKLIVIIDYF